MYTVSYHTRFLRAFVLLVIQIFFFVNAQKIKPTERCSAQPEGFEGYQLLNTGERL